MGAGATASGMGVGNEIPKSQIVNSFYGQNPTYKPDNYSQNPPQSVMKQFQKQTVAQKIGDSPLQATSVQAGSGTVTTPSTSMTDWSPVRVTHYTTGEDKYGSKTAKPNYMGVSNAVDQVSAAVDPKLIPYGSWVEIKDKNGKIHKVYAHDTGSAVKAQKASRGTMPVIDIFSKNKNLGNLDKMFEGSQYRIMGSGL